MDAEGSWPRVGCGAAIVRDGRLLLVRRRRDPEAGCWGLPGGKVDWLEPVADAAVREAGEELSIRLAAIELLCVVDHIDPEAGEHWVAPVYAAERFEGEPRIAEPHKHSGLDWFPLDRLPAPLTRATAAALPAIRARAAR